MTEPLRQVLIVEDHRLTADGVAFLLVAHRIRAVVWSGRQLVNALRAGVELPATHIVLDLDLDDGIDGVDVIPDLAARGYRVVVCSAAPALHRLGAGTDT